MKRYKKRPIYWLFSSPRGSFNALIYMHRYRPDTVSVVLNDYLREFRTKLASHKNHLEAVSISGSSSQGEKTRALKTRSICLDHLNVVGPLVFRWAIVFRESGGPTEHKWSKQGNAAVNPPAASHPAPASLPAE